jgi:hypothetical protein
MASLPTEPPPPHPSAKSRRRSSIFIAAFVLLQFAIPLTYLGRDDASDDRFTWRRFAAPDAPNCETSASLERFGGERETLRVEKLIHEDWVSYVQRGRQSVLDAFLLKQCEGGGIEQVELVNRCSDERGTRSYSLRCGGERAHETNRTAAR